MAAEVKIIQVTGPYALQYRPAGEYSVGGAFGLFMDEHWRVLRRVKRGLKSTGFHTEADARACFEWVSNLTPPA